LVNIIYFCKIYLVESSAASLSKVFAFTVIIVYVKSGKGETVVAKERISSISQEHFGEIKTIFIAFRTNSESLVTGKTFIAAPVFEVDG
jgi:hypothetical protein